MAGRHPVDALGRVLPHPGWPDERRAPGELELVRRFCNSVNHENGAERFHDAAAFDAWLVAEGVGATGGGELDLQRVIVVRDAVRRLVLANGSGTDDPAAWNSLTHALRAAPLEFHAGEAGLSVTAGGSGTDRVLARLGLAVATAVADGSWSRLKACRQCEWVVYDPSKNRSARWCSMSACGGRHNAREYRRRHRNGDASG